MDITATAETTYSPLTAVVNVLRSEYCKLRTVRSTFWTLFAAVVANVGVAALLAAFVAGRLTADQKAATDVVRLTLGGLHVSQVAIGVLGVLVISSEYSTGMIRATLSAVPRRRLVLAAKAAVFTVVSLVIGIASSFAAYFTFQATLGDPGVLRAVAGGGLYLAVTGLLGLGLGAIIRVPAGAIAALLGVMFVPPLLSDLLPQSWQTSIGPYLPLNAGGQIYIASRFDPNSLAPWTGLAVFCLYAAAALAIGVFLINHRDA
jgi:ABC-type transport system involved in multi-copper enzyme maturation permease subunit